VHLAVQIEGRGGGINAEADRTVLVGDGGNSEPPAQISGPFNNVPFAADRVEQGAKPGGQTVVRLEVGRRGRQPDTARRFDLNPVVLEG
jgi:hypothetical protein